MKNKKGFKIAIATNQACIEKGIITDNELDSIHNFMIELLKPLGGSVDYIAYCPHAPESNCDCRKPETGLLKKIEKRHEYQRSTTCRLSWKGFRNNKKTNCFFETMFLAKRTKY